MSGAASITPVWQQVKPTDVSNYLEGMDRAYTNQQQAIKDQIKVFDTALANAQQHKMNEVQQAVNALSLDQYNSPDAKVKFEEVIASVGKGIGGFDAANQLILDSVWDKRGDTLRDRETGKLNLESLGLAVGDKRDADTTTNFGQTRAAMRAEIDRVKKLPQSPERDALLGQLELGLADYETAFKTSHPDLWIRGDNATLSATTSQREAQVAASDTDNKFYDSMANGLYPQFSAYAEARKEVQDHYKDIDGIKDEKEKAAKIAERDAALAKVSTQFKDVDAWLKDPRMMASLNKRWQQELDAAANDALKREEILAKINALNVGAQADLTRAGAAVTTAEANAAKAANEILQDGKAATDKANKEAIEVNKATYMASAKASGLDAKRLEAMMGSDGKLNNTNAVTELNSLGKKFQASYDRGAPAAATNFASWASTPSGKFYATMYNQRAKEYGSDFTEAFSTLSYGLEDTEKTLLYIGMATAPSETVQLTFDRFYRSGTTRTNAVTSLIKKGREYWRKNYMTEATEEMSQYIEWVATQQGMTAQDWLKSNRANLKHALPFQSSSQIAAQISGGSTDNWNKIPNTNKKNPPVDKSKALSVGAAMGITL